MTSESLPHLLQNEADVLGVMCLRLSGRRFQAVFPAMLQLPLFPLFPLVLQIWKEYPLFPLMD